MLHAKLLLAILFLTPLINPILNLFVKNESQLEPTKHAVQFYLVVFMYLYSAAIKYFREDVHNNFSPITEELRNKVD